MEGTNKKVMNSDGLPPVSTKVIADIFGVSTRRINQMCDEGILKKFKTGSFELVPTIKKYIVFLKTKNESEKEDEEADFTKEHTLLEKAKREKAELELALMKGTMHTGEDVEREMIKSLSACRAKLLSIPTKLAPKIALIESASVVEDLIREEIYQALNELSDYSSEIFKHESFIEIEEADYAK